MKIEDVHANLMSTMPRILAATPGCFSHAFRTHPSPGGFTAIVDLTCNEKHYVATVMLKDGDDVAKEIADLAFDIEEGWLTETAEKKS